MKNFCRAAFLLGCCGAVAFAQWQPQPIATKADFRGLCVVSPQVVWVSGTKGTCARTTDGGKTWSVGTMPARDKLDFRDVEAFARLLPICSAPVRAMLPAFTKRSMAARRGRCNSKTPTPPPFLMRSLRNYQPAAQKGTRAGAAGWSKNTDECGLCLKEEK